MVNTRSADEHAEVKKLVYAADSTAVSSPNYDEVLAKAVNGFLAHAREEEEEQFAVLKSKLSSTENDVRGWSVSYPM